MLFVENIFGCLSVVIFIAFHLAVREPRVINVGLNRMSTLTLVTLALFSI